MNYETVIGLEVHVQLKTKSKLWCGCATTFGAAPNSQVCPVCLGLPGSLPVLNQKAVELGVRTGLALNCTIAVCCRFDRKQYFYPDLPKGYQITQFHQPLGRGGWVEVPFAAGQRRVGITEIHLEEEAGRTAHFPPEADNPGYSLVDYNRSGLPLLEIVTAPELRSPEEARTMLETLKVLLEELEVTDGKMEEGSLRCDANLSVHRPGEPLGKRVELKNLNSFRAMEAALAFEAGRQGALLTNGAPLDREEARTWNEAKRKTVFMRFKEQATDYRYFPEPDLPPVSIDGQWVERLAAGLPELPEARRGRYLREFRLPADDALLLSKNKAAAVFFEAVLGLYNGEAKTVSNWMLGDVTRLLKEEKSGFTDLKFGPEDLAALLSFLDQNEISGKIAKIVLAEMFQTGTPPAAIIRARGLFQINDPQAIKALVLETLAANGEAVRAYRSGKEKAVAFLVGDVMRKSKGRVNPELLDGILKFELAVDEIKDIGLD